MKRLALAAVRRGDRVRPADRRPPTAPAPSALTAGAAPADSIETRLGALNFERGYPTAETTRKLFDEMDYQRAVQAYLWAYPAVSFESIRVGDKTRRTAVDYNDIEHRGQVRRYQSRSG